MLTSVTQIAWWCGGMGLLRKAWRARSQQPLARESRSVATLCLGALKAHSPTTVVRGKGSASQSLARTFAATCARKQCCSHELPWRFYSAINNSGAGERVCFAALGARNRSALRAKAVLLPRSALTPFYSVTNNSCTHVLAGDWRAKQFCCHALPSQPARAWW